MMNNNNANLRNRETVQLLHTRMFNKRVLFITTKNLDYIRNTQEIRIIKDVATDVFVLGSAHKSYFKRLLNIYLWLLCHSMKSFDVLFIGFAPQLIMPFIKLNLSKQVIIIDFFISVFDTMIFDRNKWSCNGLMAKICHWIDKFTLKNANFVLSDTNIHGDYFSNEFGIKRDKIHTLYLEADSSIYFNQELAKPADLRDKFVVLYFGSVLPLQGTEVITEMLERLKNDIKLYFILIGPFERKVLSSNTIYYDWLSQEDLAKMIAISDLCLAGHFSGDIEKAARVIPGKAYIYESMEKPMILGDNRANREIYEEDNKFIFYVKMGDSHALADKIVEAYMSLNNH